MAHDTVVQVPSNSYQSGGSRVVFIVFNHLSASFLPFRFSMDATSRRLGEGVRRRRGSGCARLRGALFLEHTNNSVASQ